MKLFFATTAKVHLNILLASAVKNILVSYASPECYEHKILLKKHDIKLLCDSGAFSMWSLNKSVNINQYIDFIKNNEQIISRAVNLDVIPGNKGQKPTKEQIEQAAEQGWENYCYMREQNINPIHVFHEFEDFKWLDLMLENCDYIGISPCNDTPSRLKTVWLDNVFQYLDKKDRLDIKTHAFGVTAENLLWQYPWYSVDSATWALTAAMGNIMSPFGRISFSRKDKNTKEHFLNQPEHLKESIIKYFEEELGFSVNQCFERFISPNFERFNEVVFQNISLEIEKKKQVYQQSLDILNNQVDEIKKLVTENIYDFFYKGIYFKDFVYRCYANVHYLQCLEDKINLQGHNLNFKNQMALL